MDDKWIKCLIIIQHPLKTTILRGMVDNGLQVCTVNVVNLKYFCFTSVVGDTCILLVYPKHKGYDFFLLCQKDAVTLKMDVTSYSSSSSELCSFSEKPLNQTHTTPAVSDINRNC